MLCIFENRRVPRFSAWKNFVVSRPSGRGRFLAISGDWIFDFYRLLFFNRRVLCFFVWKNLWRIDLRIFCVHVVRGHLSSISGVWIFGFYVLLFFNRRVL